MRQHAVLILLVFAAVSGLTMPYPPDKKIHLFNKVTANILALDKQITTKY
jgi:hypothetical protein